MQAGPAADLLAMLGGATGSSPATGMPPAIGDIDDMFGAPAPVPAVPAFPSVTAWEKDGLKIVFEFGKPAGQAAITDITTTYTTSGAPVTDFSLQVLEI